MENRFCLMIDITFVAIGLIVTGFIVLLGGPRFRKDSDTNIDIYTLKSAYACVLGGIIILIFLVIKDILSTIF